MTFEKEFHIITENFKGDLAKSQIFISKLGILFPYFLEQNALLNIISLTQEMSRNLTFPESQITCLLLKNYLRTFGLNR